MPARAVTLAGAHTGSSLNAAPPPELLVEKGLLSNPFKAKTSSQTILKVTDGATQPTSWLFAEHPVAES